MQEKGGVPAIRFNGFTEDWERRKLGAVVKEITRSAPESDAPVMMITANNGFIEQSERYAFDNAGESLKKYILLKKGELAYNHGASKLRPYGSCFALTNAENARIPFVYHCFSAAGNNSEFLSIELNGKDVENQLRQIVSSGARMDGLLNISFNEYASISVLLPELHEQNRIADFFHHLDHLITLHQRKYSQLRNIKKSMLEKMFPREGATVPEIRFAGFTDDWEQRKLGGMVERVSTTGISSKEFPSVEYEDVVSEQGLLNKNIYQKETIKTGIRFSGEDVLYGKLRPYLHNWLNPDFQGVAVGDWWVLKPINLDKNFLYRLIQSPQFDDMANQSSGTKMPRADWKLMSSTEFCVPSNIEEQEKIGAYFHHLDRLITLHQRELERLQNIKKACLEKMFV